MAETYDVIIVGGGLVGASLACGLSRYGVRVLILEAGNPDTGVAPGFDDRAIALAYGSRMIFEKFGVWERLADKVTPITNIQITDRGHFGRANLSASEENVDALGYVILARELGQELYQAVDASDQITLKTSADVLSVEVHDDHVRVQWQKDGQTFEAEAGLLVAADGVHSSIRKQFSIPVQRWDYTQTAIVANFTSDKPHQGYAYERFTESGPMAALPLDHERNALVWTVPEDRVAELLALPDEDFIQRLQHVFGYRLGEIRRIGKRSSYPLEMLRAKQCTATRTVLLGNAAHTLHPVAGQGFNLGIRDALLLVRLLEQAGSIEMLATAQWLNRYASQREKDYRRVTLLTDGLVRLFTNPLNPLQHLRSIGLCLFDRLPPLKSALTHQMMGCLRLPGRVV